VIKSSIGDIRGEYRVLLGKLGRRRPDGKPRCRWEDNIKMDVREGMVDMDWIDLAQDTDTRRAVVNTVMNLHVP
jgi:hypothetical protein